MELCSAPLYSDLWRLAYSVGLVWIIILDGTDNFNPEDYYLEHVPGTALLTDLEVSRGRQVNSLPLVLNALLMAITGCH